MIQIRPGTEADCDTALHILQTAFAPYLSWLEPPSGVVEETVQTLRQKLSDGTMLVAEVDGRAVGCLFYTGYKNKPDRLYLGRLGVLPEFQNQGIGRCLVEVVEQSAREQGYKQVGLAVRIVLPDNIRFFESLGYEIEEAKAHAGYDQPTYYTMRKALA